MVLLTSRLEMYLGTPDRRAGGRFFYWGVSRAQQHFNGQVAVLYLDGELGEGEGEEHSGNRHCTLENRRHLRADWRSGLRGGRYYCLRARGPFLFIAGWKKNY